MKQNPQCGIGDFAKKGLSIGMNNQEGIFRTKEGIF